MDLDRAALMQVFLSDSAEDLSRMEEEVLALEDRPEETKTVDAIFRLAHTLKGNASILSFDVFAKTAHALEDVLDAVRTHRTAVTGELTNLMLAAVDALRTMLASLAAGDPEDSGPHRALMAELASFSGTGKHEPAAPTHGDAPKAASEESATAAAPETRLGSTVRLEMAKIDQLLDLAARASVVMGQASVRLLLGGEIGPELHELHQRNERLLIELQDWIMDARMIPVANFFRSHTRTVRDAARAQRKRVRLKIEGERVRVDTAIGNGAKDVLTHLVRNAIDHGIESPATRAARGKNPEGTITLRAAQTGNQVVIQVSDDGGGFNLPRIRERARALGRPNVDALPVQELYRMVFEPGFSTAERVTEMSGRGVGMDVVLRSVESLHGTVDIESTEGMGSTIELRLPLTLSVIEGFWVEVAGTDYVLPLDDVVECVEVPQEMRDAAETEGIIDVRGEPLVYLHLRELIGASVGTAPVELIVVVRHRSGRLGLAVDGITGQRQTVIKPLGRLFRSLPGISGSTIRPDGTVALVVDVSRLVRSSAQRARPLA
jgi:two-component system chemotaxis sensor kinase CheA